MSRSTAHRLRQVVVAVGLVAAFAVPLPAERAEAHPGTGHAFTETDHGIAATNETIRIRLTKPTEAPPANGFPIVLVKLGTGATKCDGLDFLTRTQLADAGYAVITVTGRGFPTRQTAWDWQGSCGSLAQLMTDGLDDSGNDFNGPLAISDIDAILDWATLQSGLNENNVGFLGHSLDGPLTVLAAAADARIKAIVPMTGLHMGLKGANAAVTSNNVAAVSNKPLVSYNYAIPYQQGDAGFLGHYDSTLMPNLLTLYRERYFHQVPRSAAVTSWANARTIVDDDAAIDKADTLTTPALVVHGWRDNLVSPENSIQLYNKLPAGNKFLYLGACTGHGNPCRPNDAANLRTIVIAFFHKYLYGVAGSLGGPIYYCVPPNDIAGADCGTLATATSWPPAVSATVTQYLRGSNVTPNLSNCPPPQTWNGLACTGSVADNTDTISHPFTTTYPGPPIVTKAHVPLADFCSVQTYTTGERVVYTSDQVTTTAKLIGFDADLWVSSSSDRTQVVVDLYEVTAGGLEKRIWTSEQTMNVPYQYFTAANTHTRFQFKPATVGYTIPAGSRFQVRVASNVRYAFPLETLPATYTIHHSATEPSSITFRYVL